MQITPSSYPLLWTFKSQTAGTTTFPIDDNDIIAMDTKSQKIVICNFSDKSYYFLHLASTETYTSIGRNLDKSRWCIIKEGQHEVALNLARIKRISTSPDNMLVHLNFNAETWNLPIPLFGPNLHTRIINQWDQFKRGAGNRAEQARGPLPALNNIATIELSRDVHIISANECPHLCTCETPPPASTISACAAAALSTPTEDYNRRVEYAIKRLTITKDFNQTVNPLLFQTVYKEALGIIEEISVPIRSNISRLPELLKLVEETSYLQNLPADDAGAEISVSTPPTPQTPPSPAAQPEPLDRTQLSQVIKDLKREAQAFCNNDGPSTLKAFDDAIHAAKVQLSLLAKWNPRSEEFYTLNSECVNAEFLRQSPTVQKRAANLYPPLLQIKRFRAAPKNGIPHGK